MDGWVRVLRLFNSISVISRRWKGEHERLCAMKRRLGSGRISPPAGFDPTTLWSDVGSANRSATRTLLKSLESLKYSPSAEAPWSVSRWNIAFFSPSETHKCTLNCYVSHVTKKPALCPMLTTKAKISMHICAVWSAPLLFTAWTV